MHHPEETMDTRELHQRGLKLRKQIFGDEAVEARMRALGDFGAPLQHIINAYAYGDIWSRPGLDNKIRSLVVLGMTAALNRPAEFGVHVRGALANGCSAEEIREVLLLIAMYCGTPAALGAFRGEELLGSSFAARWGSFGVFGPITVRPDCWESGIGKRLLEPTLALFEAWRIRQAGLFTFPQSPKHVALYQKFGFWPQALTAVMSKPVEPRQERGQWSCCTGNPASLRACAELTEQIFPGLDLQREILAIGDQALGETVLLPEGGFAACHVGKGSEAGSGVTYVKFGAVRPGRDAPALFGRLLAVCEALAVERGCSKLVAGVNTARHAAYRRMLEQGFRAFLHGVAMQRPNEAGYNRPDCFVIDDWR